MYLLGAAFLTGLLGSVHCVAMCGAFAASCTRVPRGLPAWHAGRIGTYALLGAFAGAAGHLLPGPPWLPAVVAAALLLWFALALAGLVPEPRLIPRGLTSAASRAAHTTAPAAQLAFGIANGFLPCGLVYSALSIPVALADPARGALAMLAFGAGTLPALSFAAFGLRRFVMTSLWRRRALAVLVLAAGAWAIWTRATGMITAGHHQAPAAPAMPHPTPASE
ncbi:MAG TPA: sulfite exporter TauE/SafE family protein [Gemmatimonadales bacterium]|nr:sulfite exporter TauE/SafE family protein [Gemmatimonadales bacterium]